MELFAVFSSPQSYTVQTSGGQSLGTLSQSFVDRLVDGLSCFLLGGRPWAVTAVRHDERRVLVEPAPHGRLPTWGGFLPLFLSEPISRKIRDVLASADSYPYLSPEAAAVLGQQRASFSVPPSACAGAFEGARKALREPPFWQDEARWQGVLASLPGYRLSKFQPLMPPWVEREVVGRYLLDVEGAQRWLNGAMG